LKENNEPSESPILEITGPASGPAVFMDTTVTDGYPQAQGPGILTLGELETPAGAGLAVLLPFYHPGIPGQKSVASQGAIVGLINLTQSPGQAMPAGAGLTIGAPAVYINQNIEFAFIRGNHERLTHHIGMFPLGEILGQFSAIYHDFTAPVPNIYPGNGSFSSSGSNTKILNHLVTSL
jgi:hypothetical protein